MAIGIRNEHVALPTHAAPAVTCTVVEPAQSQQLNSRPGRPEIPAAGPSSTRGPR
jgi:hypothetical protein